MESGKAWSLQKKPCDNPLWRKQIGVRNDRVRMEIFKGCLHFIKGSSIPQEKRKLSIHPDLIQDNRKDQRAVQKFDVYFKTTLCGKKSWIVWKHWMPELYWTITKLTKSHKNDPSVHRKVQIGWLKIVQITFYFCQKVHDLSLEVSKWIPWLQEK